MGVTGQDSLALVEAAQRGDRRALDRLLADYLPLVYNVVGRTLDGHADVDDVVQETLIRVVDHLGELRDPAAFRSWIVAIAVREVRARWRMSQARPLGRPAEEDAAQTADPGADFVDLTILRLGLAEQRRETALATRWLEPQDRELLALWWLETAGELSRAQLADALGLPPGHAAVRVQRMKAQLESARVVVRALAATPRCPDLAALAVRWDGRPSSASRKQFARHARDCVRCAQHWQGMVPADRLLAGLALVPVPAPLAAAWLRTALAPKAAVGAVHRAGRLTGHLSAKALTAIAGGLAVAVAAAVVLTSARAPFTARQVAARSVAGSVSAAVPATARRARRATPPPAGNLIDQLNFGALAAERAHGLGPSGAASGVGAYRQTYRQVADVASGTTPAGDQLLTFTMRVEPARQDYLTMRIFGSEYENGSLQLLGDEAATAPALYEPIESDAGGPPPFPGRFAYYTLPIPLSWTRGKTSVRLSLFSTGTGLSRRIYSAYTHIQPRYTPGAGAPVGTSPVVTGWQAPATLSRAYVNKLLIANRKAIYGPGGWYDQALSRQITPGTPGAPPETYGLDLFTPVAQWVAQHPHATPDHWRDQIAGTKAGPGYSDVPDNLLSMLYSTYLLPPLKTASGEIVRGLDHYHDPALLRRIIAALDGSTYLEGLKGGFSGYDIWPTTESTWPGLTSTPRADGTQWSGTTGRIDAGSGLEGIDTATLGLAIIALLDDPHAPAGTTFRTYLGQGFDANLDGGSVLRATAYERMLYLEIGYLGQHQGGTVVQTLFQGEGMYASDVALEKLQRLYPNPAYPPINPVVAAAQMHLPGVTSGLNLAGQLAGIIPTHVLKTHLGAYELTLAGLGESDGTDSGGYDGRYGQAIAPILGYIVYLAGVDPAAQTPAGKAAAAEIIARARAAYDSFSEFMSAQQNATATPAGTFTSDWFGWGQDDVITYRNVYEPNADANRTDYNTEYMYSDPAGPIHDAYALRAAYLQAFLFDGANTYQSIGSHYTRDLQAYEDTLRALAGRSPRSMTPLPGEPGQPDSAWADVASGAVAVRYDGATLFAALNWRRPAKGVDNVARVHYRSATVDESGTVVMPHDAATAGDDGNLSGSATGVWVLRYGQFLIVLNRTGSPDRVRLPAALGPVTSIGTGEVIPAGTGATVAAGHYAVFHLART